MAYIEKTVDEQTVLVPDTSSTDDAVFSASTQAAAVAMAEVLTDDELDLYDSAALYTFQDSTNLDTVTNATVSGGVIAPTYTVASDGGNLVPTMTSNTTPTGTVSASSTYPSYGTFTPYLAFDAVTGTTSGYRWVSNTPAAGQWIAYDFGKSTTCGGFAVTQSTDNANTVVNITGLDFQGYDEDAETWDTIASYTGLSFVANVRSLFTFETPVTYSKYRWYVTSADGTSDQAGFDGLEILGVATDAVTHAATTISSAITYSADISNIRAYLWLDPMDATVIDATEANNAIRLYFRADSSADWEFAALEDDGEYDGDVRRYKCSNLALATQGDDVQWKIISEDLGDGAPDFDGYKLLYFIKKVSR